MNERSLRATTISIRNSPRFLPHPVFLLATAYCWLAIAGWANAQPSVEQEANDNAEATSLGSFRAQLASGEFVGAIQQAKQSDDPDTALAELATKHAAAGEKAAAIAAALEIRDDLKKFQVLKQQPFFGGNFNAVRPGNNRNGGQQFGNGPGNQDNAGGGAQADFDTLIDLITTTVSPESWEDVGGTGSAAGFANGVIIDASGLMKPISTRQADQKLKRLRAQLTERRATQQLRSVSLPRLETALLARQAAGLPPTKEMLTLGGLGHIRYVLVYPESHDVVLAGTVAEQSDGDALHRLSDLAVLLHSALQGDGQLVCSITPRQQNLAETQAFLKKSNEQPLKQGQRPAWLDTIRKKMGRQDIEFFGVNPQTHLARVLVAADYHMKLVGMGLEPGVDGVVSYLDSVQVDADGNVPPLDVLRWWFTLNPAVITTTNDRDTFQIPQNLVRVQSENEMLTDRGARIHTGLSEPLNRKFATSFTEHFGLLAKQYPIYAELQRVFELAVATNLLRDEQLPERAHWQPTLLSSTDSYLVPELPAAVEVDTIVTHRVIDDRHVLAGISGGVDLAPRRDLMQPTTGDDTRELHRFHAKTEPTDDRHTSSAAAIQWWW